MYNFAFEVFIGVGDDADDYALIRCIMQENVRRNNKKREASEPCDTPISLRRLKGMRQAA